VQFGIPKVIAGENRTFPSGRKFMEEHGVEVAEPDRAPLLAPAQKVSLGSTTCGVAPGGVTACIDSTDGGHGFVLQPTGSWVF